MEGHTLPVRGEDMDPISIDFSNMSKIISFNKDDLDICVEAGLGYVSLNEYLREHGLWFPLDPGPGASVGGMCAAHQRALSACGRHLCDPPRVDEAAGIRGLAIITGGGQNQCRWP